MDGILRTADNVIPNTITTIRFRLPVVADFRIDDVLLQGTLSSVPYINVTGNFLNIPNGDTTPTTTDFTDYGNVAVGGNLGATFTIENLGPATLNIASITVTGSSAFAFAPFYTPPTSITPAPSSNPLSISFTPTTPGLQTAVVTITSNDPDEGTYTFTIQGNGIVVVCSPVVITSVFPTSAPSGTEVTINASSGSLAGATATFNGVAATVVSSSATQLVVIVPTGATTGNLLITDSQPCLATTPFTVITKDVTSCQATSSTPSELFISEVTDSNAGGLSYVEIYNGTGSSVNLSNYSVQTFSNGNAASSFTLSLNNFKLLNGNSYTVALGNDNFCSTTWR